MSIQLTRWTGNDCPYHIGTPCTKKVIGVTYCIDPCLSCAERMLSKLEEKEDENPIVKTFNLWLKGIKNDI